jgi:hypothetical protein
MISSVKFQQDSEYPSTTQFENTITDAAAHDVIMKVTDRKFNC